MADSAYSTARAQLVTVLQADATVGSLTTDGWPRPLPGEYVVVCDPPVEDILEPHSLGTSATPGHVTETITLWVVIATTKKGRSPAEAYQRRETLMNAARAVVRANQSTINSTAASAGVWAATVRSVARGESATPSGWEAKAVMTLAIQTQI